MQTLSYGVRIPLYAIACGNICAHVKDLVVHVICGAPTTPAVKVKVSSCPSSVDYGNTETPTIHRRLGSATVVEFPIKEVPKG